MSDYQNVDSIQSEYVYEQKDASKREDDILGDPYDEEEGDQHYRNEPESIESEYVYDQMQDSSNRDDIVFGDPYDEEDDGQSTGGDPSPSNNKHPSNGKKKRLSRYDSNMYALPDSEDEAKTVSKKAAWLDKTSSEIGAEAVSQKRTNKDKTRRKTWKIGFSVTVGLILVLLGVIAYFVFSTTPKGNINF